MNIMRASRLLTLAYYLKTCVDRKHFDMSVVWKDECGCALGHASYIWPKLIPVCWEGDQYVLNFYHQWDVMRRLSKIFGIQGNGDMDLLFNNKLKTPKQEAKLIEDYVKGRGFVYG